jgi:serine/threonine protein kinase
VVASLDRGLLPNGVTPYVVLELLDGETLGRRVRRDKTPLPLTEVLRIMADVVPGVAALHAAGVIHRDLKPDNIMLCRDGRVKVIDLGFALIDDEPRLTGEHERIGTPGFVAPEQVLAPGSVDERADVFSITGEHHHADRSHPAAGRRCHHGGGCAAGPGR